MLDEMLQQNSSKIAILLEYKNRFSIRATLYFFLMNADIHYGKNKVHSRKCKKKNYVVVRISKLWQILKCFAVYVTLHQK